MPCMVKCQRLTNLLLNVWNSKWPLLPSIHHMRNKRDYFLTIVCTCLKNILNYIYVNINFDFLSFLYIGSNFKISQFLCSVGIYEGEYSGVVNICFLLIKSIYILRQPFLGGHDSCGDWSRPLVDNRTESCKGKFMATSPPHHRTTGPKQGIGRLQNEQKILD